MFVTIGSRAWTRIVLTSSVRRCLNRRPSACVVRSALELPAQEKTSLPKQGYGVEQIQVLEGLDPVRRRPGMYIGSTSQKGLHQLVYEVLDNAIDEVQAGFASNVDLDIDLESGCVTIKDNGRGIPTDVHPQTKKSALETVLTVLHAGGKFGGAQSGYKTSGGLHGVGLSVVNALSEELNITVWRNGECYAQSFAHGEPTTEMVTTVQQPPIQTGTEASFQSKALLTRFLGGFSI